MLCCCQRLFVHWQTCWSVLLLLLQQCDSLETTSKLSVYRVFCVHTHTPQLIFVNCALQCFPTFFYPSLKPKSFSYWWQKTSKQPVWWFSPFHLSWQMPKQKTSIRNQTWSCWHGHRWAKQMEKKAAKTSREIYLKSCRVSLFFYSQKEAKRRSRS